MVRNLLHRWRLVVCGFSTDLADFTQQQRPACPRQSTHCYVLYVASWTVSSPMYGMGTFSKRLSPTYHAEFSPAYMVCSSAHFLYLPRRPMKTAKRSGVSICCLFVLWTLNWLPDLFSRPIVVWLVISCPPYDLGVSNGLTVPTPFSWRSLRTLCWGWLLCPDNQTARTTRSRSGWLPRQYVCISCWQETAGIFRNIPNPGSQYAKGPDFH